MVEGDLEERRAGRVRRDVPAQPRVLAVGPDDRRRLRFSGLPNRQPMYQLLLDYRDLGGRLYSSAIVIDSPGLTDFEGTPLAAVLRERIGAANLPRAKAGIVGVWTDVKVQYLAYELATRLGIERIAVSSALVASRSRTRHRAALEHLREMLGVLVFDSTPEFLAWLEVDATAASAPARVARFGT